AADELGVTPSQVALAWTRARSRAVVPIVGARSAEQLKDNLGALEVSLPAQTVERLEAATEFRLGFPREFVDGNERWVFGEATARLDGRG
ncbi:MAG TPA: aldo/keto reductase, partial [Pseudonocardia sp.]